MTKVIIGIIYLYIGEKSLNLGINFGNVGDFGSKYRLKEKILSDFCREF